METWSGKKKKCWHIHHYIHLHPNLKMMLLTLTIYYNRPSKNCAIRDASYIAKLCCLLYCCVCMYVALTLVNC